MDFSNLKCHICHNVGNFTLNEQAQLICNVCHSLLTGYQEELTDLMPGVAMRGWRASSQSAFEPVENTGDDFGQVSRSKRVKLSDGNEISRAVQLLTNIIALQVSSIRPYLRNSNGVCSTVKKVFLCCVSDEEWIRKQILRYGFRMEITLAILSLSCLYHREFLLPCHIAEKATLGEIPYINVCSKLSVQHKQTDPLKKIFETRTFPSASSIQREARTLLLDAEHCWPPLRSSIGNFLSSVSGSLDFPCSCTIELAKSMIEYFQLPHCFLKWIFPFSVFRRISQEKGLEPCGEIDVLCDLFNLLKLSLIYQLNHYVFKQKVLESSIFATLGSPLFLYEFYKSLKRLKDNKTLSYRIYHNDWNGISDEDVYKLSQLYDNVILGTERVPDVFLPVSAALKDFVEHSSYVTTSCIRLQYSVSEENFHKELEENPTKLISNILSDFVDLGLRYLGRETTEKLKKYVIKVSDTQLRGILVLMGLLKDNQEPMKTQS